MCTSVFILTMAILSAHSVTVRRVATEIISKSQTDLTQITIQCKPTDILIISAPIIVGEKTRYLLYDPRGDHRELNISVPQYQSDIHDYDTLSVNFIDGKTVIAPVDKIKIFNVNYAMFLKDKEKDEFGDTVKKMQTNDFLLGPLDEDDYGNWVLSAFYKDEAGDWAEISQVISLIIFEVVPALPRQPVLHVGDSFELRLAYSIKNLESCQLIVPKTSFDRFYDRSKLKLQTCGYVIKNVTLADEGIWKIIAIGRIMYEAYIKVTVLEHVATTQKLINDSISRTTERWTSVL
ncbi:uncharacterized protein LOC126380369 [Pectinophora gossypiella]|uniref:Macroglobulin domain-containing protein n=1 Tax=Pectinophora gossypiella TaxID=13191 RepID=A0A1E1VYT4_PECGO|nr:uncharacterized protein LOC126380369 [Pectinophora gossypiella]